MQTYLLPVLQLYISMAIYFYQIKAISVFEVIDACPNLAIKQKSVAFFLFDTD